LARAQPRLAADLRIHHPGALVSEVIEEVRAWDARALLLMAPLRNEKRQVRRWRLLLDRAGLAVPLLVFRWGGEAAESSEALLRESGAAASLQGVASLADWLRKDLKVSSPPEAGRPDLAALPLVPETG
jgi:hypothetical protein